MRLFFLIALFLATSACNNMFSDANLTQGERYYQKGLYKSALHTLMPLARSGNPKAQYAVGYMYYYGYGTAQDTTQGYAWINRAAEQKYIPALRALKSIEKNNQKISTKAHPN